MSEAASQPKQIVAELDPGVGVFARLRVDGGPWEMVWLIKDADAGIRSLGEDPTIEVRCERFRERVDRFEVLVLVFVLRLESPTTERFYQTWLDTQQSDVLEALVSQPQFTIQAYSADGQLVRSLVLANPFGRFGDDALIEAVGLSAWSARHFQDACRQIQSRQPTLTALWDTLGRPTP